MIGNYVLDIQRDGLEMTYLYPLGSDLRCMAEAMAALMLGYSVRITPPGRAADVPRTRKGSEV